MAKSDIIKSDDLIEKHVFKNTQKSAEDLNLALLDLKEAFVLINSESKKFLQSNRNPKTFEDVKQLNEELDKSVKSRKAIAEIEKQVIELNKKNKELEDKLLAIGKERTKQQEQEKKTKKELTDQEKAQMQIERQASAERVKQLKAEAILLDQRAGLEAKISAKLFLLRQERSKLKETDTDYLLQFERINKEIDTQNELLNSLSDKQKKAKANVGNYTESVRDAIDSSEAFKQAINGIGQQSGIFINATKGVVNQLKKLRTEFQEAQGAGGKFKAGLKGGGLFGALAIGTIVSGITQSSRSAENEFKILIQNIGNVIVTGGTAIINFVTNKLLPTFSNIGLQFQRILNPLKFDEIGKKIADNEKKINEYSFSWLNLWDNITKGNEAIREVIQLQDELANKTAIYTKQITLLNGQAEIQNEIAGDSTRSFNELREANIKSLELTEKRISLEKELARLQKDEAVLEVFKRFQQLGLNVSKQQIESLSYLKDSNLNQRIAIDLQNKLSESLNNYTEKSVQSSIAQIKVQRELRQIKQDELERDLDFLIDGFDNQKTINEKIITDQTKLFERRKALIEETILLANDSFAKQEKVFQEFTKKRVDLQDLVETKDAQLLSQKVRDLGLSEIIEGRVLEAVRERRLVLQDIADLERDIAIQERQKNERITESNQKITDTQYNLQLDQLERSQKLEEKVQQANLIFKVDKLKEFEQQKADLQEHQAFIEMERQKDIAKSTIVEKDELNAKLLELQAEYSEKVLTIERDKKDKIKELNRQQFVSEVNNANKLTQSLLGNFDEYVSARSQKMQQNLQYEQQLGQQRIDTQLRLAQQGSDNILAFEQQQQAKRELEQRKVQEKEQRQKEMIQLAQTYFNSLNARLTQPGADPNQAPAKALADTLLAKAISKTVVQFAKDGNERVAPINGYGGQIGVDDIPFMLTRDEGVVTRDANLGNPGVVKALNGGYFDKMFMPRIEISDINSRVYESSANNMYQSILVQQNNELLTKIDKLIQKPVQSVNVDSFGNLIETIRTEAKQTIITHKPRKKL